MTSHKNSTHHIPPVAVSIETAAKMIGLGRTSFYKLLASHEIESVRCGGRVLIPVSQLTALIEKLPVAEFGSNTRTSVPKTQSRKAK